METLEKLIGKVSRTLLVLVTPLLAFTGHSATVGYDVDNVAERLYVCFTAGNMDEWARVVADLEQEFNVSKSTRVEFELLHAQYGLIGFLLSKQDELEAERYIAGAEDHIEHLLQVNPEYVEAISIKAAILAYKIAINPLKAFYLGPKSRGLIDRAMRIEPSNPFALIESGNFEHYAPLILGGSTAKAVKFYQMAIDRLLHLNGGEAPKTWWYLNALTQLALAAEKAHNYPLATKTFEDILALEPNYQWIRDDVYPKYLKKVGAEQR